MNGNDHSNNNNNDSIKDNKNDILKVELSPFEKKILFTLMIALQK